MKTKFDIKVYNNENYTNLDEIEAKQAMTDSMRTKGTVSDKIIIENVG